MSNEKEENKTRAYEDFCKSFAEWVVTFQPTGDTSALRALAWQWFSRGNDTAIYQMQTDIRNLSRKVQQRVLSELI